jgi:hypothetical protein
MMPAQSRGFFVIQNSGVAMPRATPLQPSLNAGELSPRMVARTDFAKYPLGCATLENMIPLPQGGAMRRPGTVFVAEAKEHQFGPRLIPFQFSTRQAYVVEAGEGYFRFYKDRGRIETHETDAGISNGDFVSGVADWDDRSSGTGSIGHDAVNRRLNLAAAGPGNEAHAEQDVATGFADTEHVLRFRVVGAAGDSIMLRMGTTSTGGEIVNDVVFRHGWHSFAFTPDTSPFFVQFRNEGDKPVQIDDVSILDGAAVEIGTPYAATDLPALKFAQSADTMWICSQDYPVQKLTRSSHASWSLTEPLFDDGPWLSVNDGPTTLAPSATSGSGITVTASAVAGINGGAGFGTNDIGRLIRVQHGSDWGHVLITAVGSSTTVTADVKSDLGGTTAVSHWRLGAWSVETGYPGAIAFFEQRLGFAGSTSRPQTFWLSQSGDFENMRPDDGAGSVEDDDALDYTISADQVNAIRWMAPGSKLFMGTVGGEWLVQSDGPILTPTDIDVKRQTAFGTADVAPQQMRGRMLFLQRAARKVLEFAFSVEVDNYRALDMTLLADHISAGGFTEMAYQQELDSTLWCVRSDGQLCALAYQPDQDVIGWSRHILGGNFEGGQAVVESVTVIPGDEEDELWLVGKRTIGGATKRYVEVCASPYRTGGNQADACYVDAALRYDDPRPITGATNSTPVVLTVPGHGFSDGDRVRVVGVKGMTEVNGAVFQIAGVTTDTFQLEHRESGVAVDGTQFGIYIGGGEVRRLEISFGGLDHLEGETVSILADGAIHPDKIVSGGSIELDFAAGTVVAGLRYSHIYESLKWEAGSATGTAQGQVKRIYGVTMVLLDSLNARVGPNRASLREMPFRTGGDKMDQAVPLFTGEKYIEFDGDYATDARVFIQGDAPTPFTLLAVAPVLKTATR